MAIEPLSRARTDEIQGRAKTHAALADWHRLAIIEELAHSDRSPGELAAWLGLPSNLLAHHLRILADAGLISSSRSHGDRRRKYFRLQQGALDGLIEIPLLRARSVLFVCSGNAARSQLATVIWAKHRPDIPAASAGAWPAPRVHPRAIRTAKKHGLSLEGARPRGYRDIRKRHDLVVSVCDQAREDGLPGHKREIHWSLDDPAEADTTAAFERTFAVLSYRIDRLGKGVVRPARTGGGDR